MFKHLGYYNGEDVLEMHSATKDEIVSNMLNGFGVFHYSASFEEYPFEELNNPIGHPNDLYIITVSINEHLMDSNEDCFIDIYKRV